MSYLKIVRQISSLVTPDRSLARTSASMEKEEVSRSYVHKSGSDERHAASTKLRAWKAPVQGGPEQGAQRGCSHSPCSGPQQVRGWGRRCCPTLGLAMPRFPVPGAVGCGSRNAFWRAVKLWQHIHPILSWLGCPDSSPAWCPSVYLEKEILGRGNEFSIQL